LGAGQQCVLDGLHVGTGKPYSWPQGRPPLAALSAIEASDVDGFWSSLLDLLDLVGANVQSQSQQREPGTAAARSPDSLRAPSEQALKECLERLPNGEADDRSYLTVAVGCTGGRHRSRWLAEQVASHMQAAGRRTLVTHRER
jgi:hypothetical protein